MRLYSLTCEQSLTERRHFLHSVLEQSGDSKILPEVVVFQNESALVVRSEAAHLWLKQDASPPLKPRRRQHRA